MAGVLDAARYFWAVNYNPMIISDILADKQRKPKEKVQDIANLLLGSELKMDQILEFAHNAKAPLRGACIEAIEMASQRNAALVDANTFEFMIQNLGHKAPRVKWESARVIGNTAHLHTALLGEAIRGLLNNTEHPGTVVRWSAAYALAQITALDTGRNKDLLPAMEAIASREENNGVKKIYLQALKKWRK